MGAGEETQPVFGTDELNAAAVAIHDVFHCEGGPEYCREECVTPFSVWRNAAEVALEAAGGKLI